MSRTKEHKTVPAPTEANDDSARSPSPSSPSQKRKRTDPALTELEVDVNAPEPPSKKARRLLKKGKPVPAKPKSESPSPIPSDDAGASASEAINGETAAASKSTATATKAADKRSEYGIWIGNLAFTTAQTSLREFFHNNASIKHSDITRIHMPPPSAATLAACRQKIKPTNKGFAYVDFASAEAQKAAIEASETLLGGRKVLIKDSKSYEGRPDKALTKTEEVAEAKDGKTPGKRIFVGNLGFDMLQDELKEHFEQCGPVDTVFLATFEDTGKCKGYAWVTFADGESAAKAVRGWIEKANEEDDEDEDDEESESDDDEEEEEEEVSGNKKKNKKKPHRWWVNRIKGRQMRIEFAEDPTTRYKKRYGKAPPVNSEGELGTGEDTRGDGTEERKRRPRNNDADGQSWKDRRPRREERKVDARTIAPGKALAGAQRASAAIVEGKGKKITFD